LLRIDDLDHSGKPVTALGRCLLKARIFRLVFKGLAKLVDCYPKAAVKIGRGGQITDPHLQGLARNHVTVLLDECGQHFERLTLELDTNPGTPQLSHYQVGLKSTELKATSTSLKSVDHGARKKLSMTMQVK
jgi:hypothetical protein